MENNNKVLIDKALLESINQTLKNVREYLEQNDEALPELITNAYKGLTKALNYFNKLIELGLGATMGGKLPSEDFYA